MINNKGRILKKSQTQRNITEDSKVQTIIKKIEEKNDKPKKEEIKEDKPLDTSTSISTKASFLGGGGGTGFFTKSSAINIKNEPLGSYVEERKKIIFGKIDINKEQYYISQFLLNSQKKINNEYVKMSSGSSFFFDVPQKVYNFTLGLKENVANFCLIIKLNLINKRIDKAYEIYLLMCKQNKKSIEFIYTKINSYCKKASPAMLRFTPTISKMYIAILSSLIKLSGKFCKTTFQNFFSVLYLKTIYILTIREVHKINMISYKNDLKTHRLFIYSNCLFDCSIFSFYRYQPLCFSIYLLQHLLELYQEKNMREINRYEQLLLLKVNYNLGLFFYIDGINNEAINSLMQAKKILSEMVFFPHRSEEKDFGRNSAILENQEKHLLNKLTYFKEKINDLSQKKIDNLIIHKLSKNQNNELKVINEERTKEFPRKKSIYGPNNSSNLFLGIKRIELNQPLQFEHIKKRILVEIELLLSQIELKKKNYRGALEHINFILNRERSKDDNETEFISKKKTFNIVKTFKNMKSFQGLRIKKLSKATIEASKEDNSKKHNKNNDQNKMLHSDLNIDETFLTENDSKLIRLLLEKIEHDYTENLQIQHRNSLISNKRHSFYASSRSKPKTINYTNFKEMEKFFIFICSLSFFQLKILNESQPKISSKRNDLPIIFSNQFNDCLTNAQRFELSQLQTMSLSRYIILIDSDKDISPENLDYKYMKYKIKTSNENNEEELFKFLVEEKGKTINSRKSNDSGINSLSTNNNNTISMKRNIKKEIEFEDEYNMFDVVLMKIKNEKNKNFIESHKKCILRMLNNLNDEDKKLFIKSPNLLKKMLGKVENEMKENDTIIQSNSEFNSQLKSSLNYSFSYSK